jgi:hypothetical protein
MFVLSLQYIQLAAGSTLGPQLLTTQCIHLARDALPLPQSASTTLNVAGMEPSAIMNHDPKNGPNIAAEQVVADQMGLIRFFQMLLQLFPCNFVPIINL